MRSTGTVRQWDAARGFGFIRTPDSQDVFFHVRDWRAGVEPQVGTSVQFERIEVGGKGPRAMAVQPVGAAARSAGRPAAVPTRNARRGVDGRPAVARRRAGSRVPSSLGAAWWAALLVGAALLAFGLATHRLPAWLVAALAVLNLATFIAYWIDKRAAEAGRQRTPENTLHLFALLGGWPAARVAQQRLRHKSSKAEFLRVYAATVVAHLALLAAWAAGWLDRFVR
ncbi:MAG: DUF1294 domain-containing protein [Pseudomonadota bacterium]|nr:DUF1294 domain-containing protein [Pseudomonadota bacterium]